MQLSWLSCRFVKPAVGLDCGSRGSGPWQPRVWMQQLRVWTVAATGLDVAAASLDCGSCGSGCGSRGSGLWQPWVWTTAAVGLGCGSRGSVVSCQEEVCSEDSSNALLRPLLSGPVLTLPPHSQGLKRQLFCPQNLRVADFIFKS